MKNRGTKQLIAILLSIFFILGMVPAFTAAENEPETASPSPAQTQQAEETATPDPAQTQEAEETATPGPAQTQEVQETAEAAASPEQVDESPDPSADSSQFAELTVEEQYKALLGMADKEYEAALASLTDEQYAALEEYINSLDDSAGEGTPAVNFSNGVGSLMPAVTIGAAAVRKSVFRPAEAAGSDETSDGLVLNKSAVRDGDDYTITLEAYTTGQVTSTTTSVPCDIILVLDESGSMAFYFGTEAVYSGGLDTNRTYYMLTYDWDDDPTNRQEITYNLSEQAWGYNYEYQDFWGNLHSYWRSITPTTSATDTNTSHVQLYTDVQTRTAALMSAVNGFLSSVSADNVNLPSSVTAHRVGIIGFSSIGGSRIIRNLGTDYSSVTNLNSSGGTYIDEGLDRVGTMFNGGASAVAGQTRNRVVIVFTDGNPGTGSWSDSSSKECAANAINICHTLKKSAADGGYGSTVFTIGIFEGANPSDITSQSNRYMNAMSSNYKDATAVYPSYSVTLGTRAAGNYYLSANNTATLEDIFQSIASQTGSASIQLGASAYVQDVVSPYFNLSAGTAAVTVKTYDCLSYSAGSGAATWDNTATTLSGASVSFPSSNALRVTGFDFDANYLAETGRSESDSTQAGSFHGKKLVIEFTVTVRDGFLGGNNVPTNTQAKVYDSDDQAVGAFNLPTVNVPIPDVTVNVEDKNVYLLGSLSREQLQAVTSPAVAARCGGVTLDLSSTAVNYGLESWQNAFVTITPALTHGTGTNETAVPAAGLADLAADDTFKLTVSVAPVEGAATGSAGPAATEKSGNATGSISVFKPELTFSDSVVYLGEAEPDYDASNFVGVTWKHGTSVAPSAMGAAPGLTLVYHAETGAILNGKIAVENDIQLNVAVKIGGTDVTGHTAFLHQDCSVEGCTWAAVADTPPDGSPAFLLHVKTCRLTLAKQGGREGESYVFTVRYTDPWNGGTVTLNEVIQGNGSKIIAGLPIGGYTVQEAGNWSWRFGQPGAQNATLSASATGSAQTVTITNSQTNSSWLSAENYAVNRWIGGLVNRITGAAD